ncbi:MAG: formimidoylglutamate deiminase [Paracoccaceae bacterium]
MPRLHARHALLPDGWHEDIVLHIGDDGRIAKIDTGLDGHADWSVPMILPAPVNLHSHAFQRAMAGLTEMRGPDPRDTFWTWRQLMFRFLDRLTPDHVEAIAAQVFVEMLEAGYAAVAEFHYLHHDRGGRPYANPAEMAERIVAAAQDTGIGLTLLPVLYTQGGCDGRPLQGGQQRFGTGADDFALLHEASQRAVTRGHRDARLGVAPHSLRAVSPSDLAAAVALAGDGPIHMHLAEQVAEVDEVSAALGARPTEWLLGNHDVGARWCLIHATQMIPSETRALARTGAVAGLCPITEANLGDGIFDATGFLANEGRFGVGSDSNIHIALFEELAQLEYSQRLRDRGRAILASPTQSAGRRLFTAAATGSAQAAGRASGQIAVGMQADLVGLGTDSVWLCGRTGDRALDTLVFGGHGRDCITDVWSAGRHVVSNGRHARREAVASKFKAVMDDLGSSI